MSRPASILFVLPTSWDGRQLAACRAAWHDRFRPRFAEPSDEACPDDFDLLAFIGRQTAELRGQLGGVTSSSDYPGATVAAALAGELSLPGPTPAAVLSCSHKLASRRIQARVVPEATPRFAAVDSRHPESAEDLFFPCFVKPVKGAFSVLARRIDSPRELVDFLRSPVVVRFTDGYLGLFNRLVEHYTDLSEDGHFFVAEEVLRGEQVTVEGYCDGGRPSILGLVDSLMVPGTRSFGCFRYPSILAPDVQARMRSIVHRAVEGVGLRDAFFNVELIYDAAADRISIIEMNPRICGQFGDLYQKVDGVNSYQIALAVASGATPPPPAAPTHRWAGSFPLRAFEPARVVAAPDPARITAVEKKFPGTLVWSECRTGQLLGDFAWLEDGASVRFAVVNLGADSPAELDARKDAVVEALGFEVAPTGAAGC